MFVEIQLRTITQHLWSTSVETTDLFRNANLKEKDDGTYWHDFFCQVSAIFAIAEEAKPIPGYENLSINEICNLLQENMAKNSIGHQIAGFTKLHPAIDFEKDREAYYVIMELNMDRKEVNIFEYPETMYETAFGHYQKLEQSISAKNQVVLISLNQIKKLHSAYPNYFADLRTFISIIEFLLAENKKINYNNNNE